MKRRSSMPPQRYTPSAKEPLAVDPKAFLELFVVPSSREPELVDDVCVIDVCGPLEQYDAGWCDSYEAIKRRVGEACASAEVKSIVMRIDSPGGAVSGCFDTVRAIRTMCQTARKPLFAYCDHACSAGYALATAATHGIATADTGTIGSIGVLQTRPDYSAQNAARGVRIEFITSGARKADGNLDAPITDDEIAATRERVNYAAGLFFALVQETRGIPVARVEAMQAGVFHAEGAQRERLVDGVMSFEALLALAANGGTLVMTAFEKAKAALEEAAEGDDANAVVARKALAALTLEDSDDDEDDEDKSDSDDDADAKSGDDEPKAASGDDEPKAESEDSGPGDEGKPKKQAAASGGAPSAHADTHSIALEALAKAHSLEAQIATDRQRTERERLLAKRPDFAKELRAELMKASTPIDTVRRLVKTLPRKPIAGDSDSGKATARGAAASTVAGTRGATQGANQSDVTPPPSADDSPRARELAAIDAQMGLTDQTLGVFRKGNALCFGVVNKPRDAAPSGGKQATK